MNAVNPQRCPVKCSREQAEEVKTRVAPWLAPGGLALNEDKTHVVHLDEGFDSRVPRPALLRPTAAHAATIPGQRESREGAEHDGALVSNSLALRFGACRRRTPTRGVGARALTPCSHGGTNGVQTVASDLQARGRIHAT